MSKILLIPSLRSVIFFAFALASFISSGAQAALITVDAQALSAPSVEVRSGSTSILANFKVSTINLNPGSYVVGYNTSAAGGTQVHQVAFTVTQAGLVDYSPQLDGILSGRGTASLIVNGLQIYVHSLLSPNVLEVTNTKSWRQSDVGGNPVPLLVLPGQHQFGIIVVGSETSGWSIPASRKRAAIAQYLIAK